MATGNDFEREVTFEIVESIGVIASYPTGWKKELNLVSWNGGHAKYDIRDWDPSHEHMSRGVTLHDREMRQIMELLKTRYPQEPVMDKPKGNDPCGNDPCGNACSCGCVTEQTGDSGFGAVQQ